MALVVDGRFNFLKLMTKLPISQSSLAQSSRHREISALPKFSTQQPKPGLEARPLNPNSTPLTMKPTPIWWRERKQFWNEKIFPWLCELWTPDGGSYQTGNTALADKIQRANTFGKEIQKVRHLHGRIFAYRFFEVLQLRLALLKAIGWFSSLANRQNSFSKYV